jgi:hypothetical protein
MRTLFNYFLFLTLILVQSCTNNIRYKNMKYKLNFYTEYSQFYIISDMKQYLETEYKWDEEGYNDRLVVIKNQLTVITECYGPVKGELVVLKEANNNINLDLYDHIVEGGLEVSSGVIQILDCPTSSVQSEIKIANGTYRVRVYSSNLSSVDGDEGEDYYKIEIWEGDNLERKVLKKYIRK